MLAALQHFLVIEYQCSFIPAISVTGLVIVIEIGRVRCVRKCETRLELTGAASSPRVELSECRILAKALALSRAPLATQWHVAWLAGC